MTDDAGLRGRADDFPAQLGGLDRGPVALVEPERPEAGVAITYEGERLRARVTLYDRGAPDVPDGPHSAAVYREVNRVLADLGERVEVGMYQSVHIIDQLVTDRGPGEVAFFAIEFEYRRRGARIGAGVYLTGHDGAIVKLCLDHTEGRADAARTFVRALGALLGAPRRTNAP